MFRCTNAHYTVGTHKGKEYVLVVDTSPSCPYEIIEAGRGYQGSYGVTGYIKDHTQLEDRLLCTMYPVQAKKKAVGAAAK